MTPKPRYSYTDERGLAVGILAFIIMIGMGALLYILLNAAMSGIFDTTLAATASADATDVINEREQIAGLLMFYAVFLGAVFIIARSVFESRSGF